MTIETAKTGINELFAEGYGPLAVEIYINDLRRGGDITWDESRELKVWIINGRPEE